MGRNEGMNITAELAQSVRAVRLIVFDFDGVFTDNMVYVFEDGREAVRCSRADGIGLRKLEQLGVEPYIISSEPNAVVAHRSHKLKVGYLHGCKDKRVAMDELLQARDLTPAQAAFVGNDINDLPALQFVGLPIVVQDAHPDVIPLARYQTKHPGGRGAVREICDLFQRVLISREASHASF